MYHITIQHIANKKLSPATTLLQHWATAALSQQQLTSASLTIRLVTIQEITFLNETYRQKQGATNVLSFPFVLPDNIPHKTNARP